MRARPGPRRRARGACRDDARRSVRHGRGGSHLTAERRGRRGGRARPRRAARGSAPRHHRDRDVDELARTRAPAGHRPRGAERRRARRAGQRRAAWSGGRHPHDHGGWTGARLRPSPRAARVHGHTGPRRRPRRRSDVEALQQPARGIRDGGARGSLRAGDQRRHRPADPLRGAGELDRGLARPPYALPDPRCRPPPPRHERLSTAVRARSARQGHEPRARAGGRVRRGSTRRGRSARRVSGGAARRSRQPRLLGGLPRARLGEPPAAGSPGPPAGARARPPAAASPRPSFASSERRCSSAAERPARRRRSWSTA